MTEPAALPEADHTAPRSIRRWLRAYHANGWLQLVGVLIVVELFLVLLFNTGFEVLSAARAYVGGESLYSKGQKDAVGHLRDFAASHAEQDYQLYLTAIGIPLGDRQARLELEKPQPDAVSMYAGLVQGGNNANLTELEIEFSSTLGEAARWVQGVLLLAEGLVTAILLSIVGVLGARRIFHRLSLSEADYRELVDSAVDAVIAVDADGHIVLFNRAAEKVFDQTPQAVVGMPLNMLLSARAGAASESDSAQSTQARPYVGRHRDGTVFEAECGVSRSTLAGRSGSTYIVRDITERTRVQAALAASESRAKQESERLMALHHASALLAAHTAEPGAVLDEILRSALTLLQGDGGALYQWDATSELLRCVRNVGPGFDGGARDLRSGEGLAGQTFSRGLPVIVTDSGSREPPQHAGPNGTLRAGLGVPLIRRGTRLGVLLIGDSVGDRRHFDDTDAQLAALFAARSTVVAAGLQTSAAGSTTPPAM